jgi:hypothetical protein
VSGDCKRETGHEHSKIVQTVLNGVNNFKEKTKLRIVAIASDGETRRGSAFIQLTFKCELSPRSPLFELLRNLKFLNLYVGDDDLTCDKDWKHVFKRWRNLIIRPARGIVINGHRITADISKDQFRSEGFTADHIRSLFNPEDQQDVKLALDMLKDICTLCRDPANRNSGFMKSREALWLLGKLLFHMVFPYVCTELSLSEQIEHLSAAAHLVLTLYRLGGKQFIPTNLYIDFMTMVKNVVFCIAKAKIDDPNGKFFLILQGTDRLEELFGILRTMVGNDANLDILQLISRLAGTTEVSNILAKYPHWDRAPRWLQLYAISRESKAIPDSADHIKPAAWKGNVHVKDVSLQTSWNRGRRIIKDECDFLKPILQELDQLDNIDILSPFGVLLVKVPLAYDDIDDSLEIYLPSSSLPTSVTTADEDIALRIEVEDGLGELASVGSDADATLGGPTDRKFDGKISIQGVQVSKARALSRFNWLCKHTGSTDRLKRVQDVSRFVESRSNNQMSEPPIDDSDILVISDPITTLVRVEDKFWLCLGEVSSIRIDGQSVGHVTFDMLMEDTVTVSYQMLGLKPTTLDDDPENIL